MKWLIVHRKATAQATFTRASYVPQDLLAQDAGSGQYRLQNCWSRVAGGISRNPGLVNGVQFRRSVANELRNPARGRGRVPERCLGRQLRRCSVHTHRVGEGELDPA